jgi:hypothetical protein
MFWVNTELYFVKFLFLTSSISVPCRFRTRGHNLLSFCPPFHLMTEVE